MKLLIDMNLSPRWQPFLEQAGFSAVHWSKIGKGNDPDSDIMAYAGLHSLSVFTGDLDFGIMLVRSGRPFPSVIQIRGNDTEVESVGAFVVNALVRLERELEEGALLTIDPPRLRVRLVGRSAE